MNEKNNDNFEVSSDTAALEEHIHLAEGFVETYSTSSTPNDTYSGVYKLKNKGTNLFVTVNTDNATSAEIIVGNDNNTPNQWYKVTHLGGGQYSIRPVHKMNLALTARKIQNTTYAISAIDVGTCDTLQTIDVTSRWTIDSNGIIRNALYDCTVIAASEYGNVTLSVYTGATNQQWSMSKIDISGSIEVTVSNDSILVGNTTQLSAQTNPSGKSVNWSSSNTYIATVSSAGVVTFKHPGAVEITAYANGQYPKTVTLYGILRDGVYNLFNSGSRMYVRMDGVDLFENESSLSQDSVNNPLSDVRMMWRLHYHGAGKYSIRSYANPRRGIYFSDKQPSVSNKISSSDTINNRVGAWNISSDNAGYILTNLSLLDSSAASVLAVPAGDTKDGTKLIYADSAGTISNSNRRWDFKPVSTVPTGLYLFKYNYSSSGRLSSVNAFTASSITLTIGNSAQICAVYRDPNDPSQDFTWISSNSSIADCLDDNKISAKAHGTVTVTVKHDRSNTSLKFDVRTKFEDEFLNILIEQYKFSEKTSKLIRKLYDKLIKVYPDESKIKIAWRFSRLLGGLSYNTDQSGIAYLFNKYNFEWDDVAGNPISPKSSSGYPQYFIECLGFTEDEYDTLDKDLDTQSDTARANWCGDFPHCMMSLAARLACYLDYDKIASNFAKITQLRIIDDITVSYLAGWLGDATIPVKNGHTSLRNDDYIADLDAENLYQLIIGSGKDNDIIQNIVSYWQTLSTGNRASIFLDHVSMYTVQSAIFRELVPNITSTCEQLDYLYKYQHDTYNFIVSLQNRLKIMGDYYYD